jgi:hypothetical protein
MSKVMRAQAEKLDVRQFKLMNGEDVVACVVSETDQRIEVEGPLQIYESMDDGGEYSIALRQWLSMSIDTNAMLLKTGIITSVKMDIDNKELYLGAIVSMAKSNIQDESIEETISGNQSVH